MVNALNVSFTQKGNTLSVCVHGYWLVGSPPLAIRTIGGLLESWNN